MLSAVFLLFLAKITFETAPVYGQSIHASRNPTPIGSNVTLYIQESFTAGAWMFNNSLILMVASGNVLFFEEWQNRVTVNFTANHTSMTITSLQLNDSGEYRLQKPTGKFSIVLSVQEPISNVTLTAQATDLVEFNDSAVFTCSVSSGTSLSYSWLNGSNSVVSGGEGVQLSNGGANLTIRVTRYDRGPFSCNVSNGISQEVSPAVYLKISYGPSNTSMTLAPMGPTYRIGDSITLSCSADSNPAARIWWMVNGMQINRTGSHLQLQNVTESNSGNYTCIFHNNVTSRFTSESKVIKILAPVTVASVKIVGSQPILNRTFALTCQTTGTVESVAWMYNWSLLYSDNRRMLSVDNTTLTFNPLVMSDNGNYSCMASNAISSATSKSLLLDILYGPEVPCISGPTTVKVGDNVTLICHAPSNPPSSYKWLLNGSVVANTAMYMTPPFTMEMKRVYTCVAYNNVTDKNSTASKTIVAIDPITDAQIESSMKTAIEGQRYTLTCNVTGPADVVYWFKNGQKLQAQNQTIFTDHKTVMFNPLQNNHSGLYHCYAMNMVSTKASSPYLLLVNFGPEMAMIEGPDFAEVGTTALFHCSANSYPTSDFTWWFNGSEVANTSTFTTASLSFNMSGVYTCVASNNVTGGRSSATRMLTVVEATQLVITNSSNPIQHQNFTLTCEVNRPYEQIYWLKNDTRLNANANTSANANASATNQTMSYRIENNTLHFTPVSSDDDGEYKCVAINQAGEHQSPPFVLLVNYGPLSVTISGPDSVLAGTIVTLECSASSRPTCDFYWHVNTQEFALTTGPKISFPATKMHQGTYTCVAKNPVTNISLPQSKMLVVGKGAMLQAPSYGALLSLSVFAFILPALFNREGR